MFSELHAGWFDIFRQIIQLDEGKNSHPYWDLTGEVVENIQQKGKITIGYGRNLSDVGLSQDEMDYLLKNDMWQAVSGARAVFGLNTFANWSMPRQHGATCLVLNLGAARLLRDFIQTVPAMKAGKWAEVDLLLHATKWARDVDPKMRKDAGRDDRIINMITKERYDPAYKISYSTVG